MIPLTEIAPAFIKKHGAEKAAELTGVDARIVAKWAAGTPPSVINLQKLVDFDKTLTVDASDIEIEALPVTVPSTVVINPPPAPYEWPQGKRVAIMMPSNRAPH